MSEANIEDAAAPSVEVVEKTAEELAAERELAEKAANGAEVNPRSVHVASLKTELANLERRAGEAVSRRVEEVKAELAKYDGAPAKSARTRETRDEK